MLKTSVSSARNVGMSLKKRRFLKLIHILIGIKKNYHIDFQLLLSNAKNKRFSLTNDNSPTNIGCMYGQNSLFVDLMNDIFIVI